MKKQLRLIAFFATTMLSVSIAWSGEVTGTLVALNKAEATVSLIDLKSGEVRATLPTGEGPHEAAVSPDGRLALAADYGTRAAPGSSLTVIDVKSLEVVATIECASFPIRAKATPDGKHVLVSCARSGDLAVIDTASRKVVRRIPQDLRAADTDGLLFGSQFDDSSVPIGIVTHPEGGRAWVAHTNADVIAEIDLETWRVSRLLKAGREPDGMDYSPIELPKQ